MPISDRITVLVTAPGIVVLDAPGACEMSLACDLMARIATTPTITAVAAAMVIVSLFTAIPSPGGIQPPIEP